MGSIQNFPEPSIEDTFGIPPISGRNSPNRIPSFRRGFDYISESIAAKRTVSGTMCSSGPSIPSVTSSVHESPSVHQTVAVESCKNESAIVGREGKRQQSDFDHGSMSWFGMCFRGGGVQA